jgi:RNA polymerase sigma-70 factor (ECF subfamily)
LRADARFETGGKGCKDSAARWTTLVEVGENSRITGQDRHEFFRRILVEYGPALRRLANSYEADAALREDLLQEILLALWKAIPRFRGDSSERTWLYRIAHNTAITAIVSWTRRRRIESPLPAGHDPSSSAETPEHRIAQQQEREALFQAIRELPLTDRQVITLHLDGLSYAEIEQVTDLSQSAIATRLSRIRSRLTAALGTKEKRR